MVYLSLNQKELLGRADLDRTFLVFELKVDGQTVSRNEIFFDTMRNLALPLKPTIQSNITGAGNNFTLTLRSPVLTRNVYLSFGDLNVQLSDNYFDLLPGEEVTVRLTTSASLDQLQRALKTMSLTDAFFDQRPSYRQHLTSAVTGNTHKMKIRGIQAKGKEQAKTPECRVPSALHLAGAKK